MKTGIIRLVFVGFAIWACTAEARVYLTLSRNLAEKTGVILTASGTDKHYMEQVAFILERDLNYSDYFTVRKKSLTVSSANEKNTIGISVIQQNKTVYAKVIDLADKEILFEKQYTQTIQPRMFAHRVCNDIVFALTGKPGIAESRICFVSSVNGITQLHLVDYDGDRETQMTSDAWTNNYPSWMPDNRRIIFTTFRNRVSQLVLMDMESKNSSVFLGEPGMNAFASPNPGFPEVAAVLSKSGNLEIYLVGTDGTVTRRLTTNRRINTSPCFSPDGEHIAFVSDMSGSPQIYVMDREGNNVERVSFGYPCAVSPAWSPDGQFLSYAVKKAGIYTLILHDMDKKTDNEMSSALGWSEEPSWAPDSMHIVFTRREGDKPSLWVLDVFTEEARPLCPGRSSPDFSASWSH